jgi:hypothetical protein
MSGQVNDKFEYENDVYSISAIEFPNNFFTIESFRLKPIWENTACWRGYVATFTIKNNKLILNKLSTNNGNRKNDKVISLNGKFPSVIKPRNLVDGYKDFRKYEYINVDYILKYTGSIIITNKFIWDQYIHTGFQSPGGYNNVIQITFDNGEFVEVNDLLKIATSICDNKIKLALNNTKRKNLMQWIDDYFYISFYKTIIDLMENK